MVGRHFVQTFCTNVDGAVDFDGAKTEEDT